MPESFRTKSCCFLFVTHLCKRLHSCSFICLAAFVAVYPMQTPTRRLVSSPATGQSSSQDREDLVSWLVISPARARSRLFLLLLPNECPSPLPRPFLLLTPICPCVFPLLLCLYCLSSFSHCRFSSTSYCLLNPHSRTLPTLPLVSPFVTVCREP